MSLDILSKSPLADSKASTIVKSEFTKIASAAHFDSLSLLLDFSQFVHAHSLDAHSSWTTLFSQYTPKPAALRTKSTGGTSILYALLAQELCAQHGISSVIFSEQRPLHPSLFFPQPHHFSPSPPQKWAEAETLLDGITHLMCVYREPFSESQKSGSKITVLQQYFTQDPLVHEFHSYDDFSHHVHQYSPSEPTALINANEMLKKTLQTSLSYHIIHPVQGDLLTFNLLDGSLSLHPCSFPAVPRNIDGKASFSIYELYEHSERSTPVLIDNEPSMLLNSDLLRVYLESIRSAYGLQADFSSSILFFVANRKKMFSDVLCTPSLCLMNVWNTYTEVDELRRQAHFLRENLGIDPLDPVLKSFLEGERFFCAAESCVYENKEEAARLSFLNAKNMYIKFFEACSIQERTPYAALLLNFVK
jgi:hypothetical protein